MEKDKALPINKRPHTFVQTTTINNSQLTMTKLLINFPDVPQIKPHFTIVITKIQVINDKFDPYKIEVFYILEEVVKGFIATINAIKKNGTAHDYEISHYYKILERDGIYIFHKHTYQPIEPTDIKFTYEELIEIGIMLEESYYLPSLK